MKHPLVIALLTLLIVVGSGASALATDIDVVGLVGEGYTGDLPSISSSPIRGSIKDTTTNGNQVTFKYDIDDADAIGELRITLPASQPDFASYDQQFSVAYGRNNMSLFGGVFSSKSNDDDVLRFASQVVWRKQMKPSEVFAINQRARAIFHNRNARFGQSLTPIESDFYLAYWLIYSSANLVQSVSMVVDDDTANAESFLQRAASDGAPNHALYAAFLAHSRVTQANIDLIYDVLDQRDQTVRTTAIGHLQDDLGVAAKRPGACVRIGTLNAELADGDDDTSAQTDMWVYQRFVVLSLVVNCLTVPGGAPTPDQVEQGRQELGRLAELATTLTASDLSANRRIALNTTMTFVRDYANSLGLTVPAALAP
jgi:hypothetical protein